MKSRLKQEWNNKLHMALGYQIVEDEEGLKALNNCIKGIIQTEKIRGISEVRIKTNTAYILNMKMFNSRIMKTIEKWHTQHWNNKTKRYDGFVTIIIRRKINKE